MKITTTVSIPDVDVDVHITGDDIINGFLGDGSTLKRITIGSVNNLAGFFRKLPDAVIADFTPEARKLIRAFFEEQATRFADEVTK